MLKLKPNQRVPGIVKPLSIILLAGWLGACASTDHSESPSMTPADQAQYLMQAAGQGDKNIVQQLISNGADVNFLDASGNSPLSEAALQGKLTIVKMLIKAGSDVNITPKGESLLMHIVRNNDLLTAQVLIAAGADVNFHTAEGVSALSIAKEKGYGELEMLLIQSGAQS
ncbi:MAG: ankyrin repeat domain-containing protein [Hahellaceae bacterium]|nr:ankyrin repeat domain-containing protein [Anaerolineae bacterium]MCP5163127.1 ankyrin repeat domain-containing protein [Hahellaceae bacterium]MCP5169200.1 ankyrin repeat domain-containing protein [Hahellaceae bacterium]